MKTKYFVKYGYFGEVGKKYISYFKYLIYKYFTDYSLYKEVDGKEIWMGR